MAGTLSDPDVVLYAAWISVWGRWFVWLVGVFLLAYRPAFWYPQDIGLLLLHVVVLSINSLVHHRLLTKRPVTWRWMLFLCAMDIALITANIVIDGGFSSFIFLAYYPSLAIFAAVFLSSRLTLAWTTAIAVAYAAVCLMVGSGLDLGAGKEKALVARLAAMYTTVLGISLINRFERTRWRTAVASERQLRRTDRPRRTLSPERLRVLPIEMSYIVRRFAREHRKVPSRPIRVRRNSQRHSIDPRFAEMAATHPHLFGQSA